MNTCIESLMENLGFGKTTTVAYDTAAVALVPNIYNKNEPQFPEALEWIINNQLSDGAWGASKPYFASGNIASTLAALIAIKTWDVKNNSKYDDIILKGELALNKLSEEIKIEAIDCIGYEVIVPALLEKAVELKINVPFNRLLLQCEAKTEKKIKFIETFLINYGLSKKNGFWFNLELMEGYRGRFNKYIELFDDSMLDSDGSICLSPAATAFYLRIMIEKKDYLSIKAWRCIKNLMSKGGAPQYTNNDTHEIGWSLKAFIMGGMDLNTSLFKPKLELMFEQWIALNGLIPISSISPYFFDCDCTSVYIYVLRRFNYITDEEAFASLQTFFNGNYFICYEGESNSSTSVNFHAIIALKSLNKTPQIEQILSNWKIWIKSQISKEYVFTDKWFLSQYYTLSRAVFALQGIDDNLCEQCIDQILSHQNRDNGWGFDGTSTLEETAMVVLALRHWYTSFPNKLDASSESFFLSINKFIDEFSGDPHIPLWITKGLSCLKNVADAYVIASKHALTQLLHLSKL